jgi:hypothetical protein
MDESMRDAAESLTALFDRNLWKDFKLPEGMTDDATGLAESWADEFRRQMETAASDIVDILDRALYDGIHKGGMRGLGSLGLGFLGLINDVILGQLKKALTEALTTSSTGGGWLGKIVGWITGAAVGSVGGGGGNTWGSFKLPSIGGRAAGGPVSANTPYMVGERGPELFMPNASGRVVPNNKMGGTTINHINVTVPAPRMQTFKQTRSRRELAERIAALVTP